MLSSLFVTHCDSYTLRAYGRILHDYSIVEEEGLLSRKFRWMWTGGGCPISLGSPVPLSLHHLIGQNLVKLRYMLC